MSKVLEQREPTRREQIMAGPWKLFQPDIYAQRCQVCHLMIHSSTGEAYLRPGDDLSPALYRHKECHEKES